MQGYTIVAVFSLSGYRYLGDGGTDRREILHDGTYTGPGHIFSPFRGGTLRGPANSKFWPFDREHLENGKSQLTCQLEFNISWTTAF